MTIWALFNRLSTKRHVSRELRRWCMTFVLLIGAFWGQASHADAAPQSTVYFAGVAYTTDAADVSTAFPHVAPLLDKSGTVRFDQALRQVMQGAQLPERVVFDALGSTVDAEHATALALALDGETTTTSHIGSVYKLRVEVSGQALFFDYRAKQVLGGFPFIVDYITALPARPTPADIAAAFQRLVFGGAAQGTLIGTFAQTLQEATVPNPAAKHLRVTSVTLGPKALAYLSAYAPNTDVRALPKRIAQSFSTYLAANQHLALLPYASSQALGAQMAMRFAQGDVFDLKIPQADYAISLDVAGFKQLLASQTSAATVYLYGAFVNVNVAEPLSGHLYFDQSLKQGETKVVPAGTAAPASWPPTYDTLKSLFANFTDSLTNQANPWRRSGLPDTADARKQLSSLQELIASCR